MRYFLLIPLFLFAACERVQFSPDSEVEVRVNNAAKAEAFKTIQRNAHAVNDKSIEAIGDTLDKTSPHYEFSMEMAEKIFASENIRIAVGNLKIIGATENKIVVACDQMEERATGRLIKHVNHTLHSHHHGWKIFSSRVKSIRQL